MPKATTRVQGITITPADSSAPTLLVVDVEISCPHCGVVQFRFFGHHLTQLIQLLEVIRDQNPGLVGEPGDGMTRRDWGGTAGGDPSRN